jgi:hypothetical protein
LPELRSLRVGTCCRHGKIQEPTAKDSEAASATVLTSCRVPVA